MDNKQKRKLLTSIYRTINMFSLFALALIIYLTIEKIVNDTNSILWLNVVILIFSAFLLLYLLADIISTRKLTNKYKIGQLLYFIFFNTFISLIVLSLYCYFYNVDFMPFISYLLPISLIFATELILIINFVIGLSVSKLHKNTTIVLDSMSDTPNFNDEILLKKRLDELNRKLAIKKIQTQIQEAEKELDE